MANKLEIIVDNQSLDITDDVEVSISYNLEDESDFQKKKSSEALSINLPATLNNEQISGNFGNISILNIPEGSKDALIKANGITLLAGKAFIRKAYHQDRLLSYDYDFYGNNANWIIGMQTLTLYDILRDLQFTFSAQNIGETWSYDGRPTTYPPGDPSYRPLKHILVFAPVRAGRAWDDYTNPNTSVEYKDSVWVLTRATPSLSVFYIIQRAFQQKGYKIQSDFFDTDYFRRLVMPWTWGAFALSDGTKIDVMKIAVENTDYVEIKNTTEYIGFVDINPDFIRTDESNCYSYDATTKQMRWTYDPTQDFGLLQASFEMQLEYHMDGGPGYQSLWVRWYKNGTQVKEEKRFRNKTDQNGTYSFLFDVLVNTGDTVGCAIFIESYGSAIGPIQIYDKFKVIHFQTSYFKQTLGSSINFENYLALKDYKFLDFLRGVIDCFDLSIQTDDIRKIVITEPTHDYSLNNDLSDVQPGYFNGGVINMDGKHDLSQKSDVTLFNDTNKSQVFRFKKDDSDGGIKGVGDFKKVEIGAAKFTLPDRFADDETSNENRFFGAMMHTEMPDLTKLNNGVLVYLPALLPENISDTSKDAAQNTLLPKLAYYNGTRDKVFIVKASDDEPIGNVNPDVPMPEMFAVNYMAAGQNSPNLNYNDELVNGVIVPGLLRRFYIKRMAIIRQGTWYNTFMKFSNLDILNNFHREYYSLKGQKLELVQINNYNPLSDKSTSVLLRKDAPVTDDDLSNCAPSINSVTNNDNASLGDNDLPYWPAALAAPGDITSRPKNV